MCDCVHSSVHFRTLGRAKLAQVSRKYLISKQTNKQKHRAPLEAENRSQGRMNLKGDCFKQNQDD